jgi:CRP-like cAMP-binding protein
MVTARIPAAIEGPDGPQKDELNLAECVVLMSASAFFTGLSSHECEEIAFSARARTFARNELLFAQGQPIRNLVLIQTGSVKLFQSADGDQVILWMNGSGDTVCMPAESSDSSYTCSARAMEKCRTLIWEYDSLQNLLVEYPQIRKNISQILSSRLNELEERFREVATARVAKRVALTLMRLLKQVGKMSGGGIEVLLSREELAQMTGTTLFTVSRILSKWKDAGFVEPRREAVVVLDQRRLMEEADG